MKLAVKTQLLILRPFRCRGIMTEVMVNIPVHVITGSHVALDGAALWTLERLGK